MPKNDIQQRLLLYYSAYANPVMRLFQLKPSHDFSLQRFCSLETLKDLHLELNSDNYFSETTIGFSSSNDIVYESEKIIKACANSSLTPDISVGDVLEIFIKGKEYNYFVDSIGLQELSSF